MYAFIKHNTFINYDKYNTHKDDSIGWFKFTGVTLHIMYPTYTQFGTISKEQRITPFET